MIERLKASRRKIQYKIKYWSKIKKIHKQGKKCVFCFSWPVHGNLGDQALAFVETEFLMKLGIPIEQIIFYTTRDCMRYWEYIKGGISEDDVILIRGGGCWGTLWIDGFSEILKVIESFPRNEILVFPQSVYFEDNSKWLSTSQRILRSRENVTIFARDKVSYEIFRSLYPDCIIGVSPDIVLSYEYNTTFETDKILLCFREDREKLITTDIIDRIKFRLDNMSLDYACTDTVMRCSFASISEGVNVLQRKWMEFSQAKLVITDRLHGMIFSTICGTPCIVFDNVDKKVSHEYEWIADKCPYVHLINEAESIEEILDQMLCYKKSKYPREELLQLFEPLKLEILRKVNK